MVKYSFRPPPLDVPVKVDADHLVRGKESVFDALLQRIRVDRFAEVVDVGDIFRFLRSGGEADLGGGTEVVQNFSPGTVFCRTAAMAFVNHDQVEEVRGELLVNVLLFVRAGFPESPDDLKRCKCLARTCGQSIMKQEGVAIGAEDEGNVERSGVIQSLLHSTADAVVIVFGFDERERHVRFVGQQEVCELPFPSSDRLPLLPAPGQR